MNDQELSALFEKLLKNQCSEDEADRILALFADEDTDSDLKNLIINQLNIDPSDDLHNNLSEATEKSLNLRLKEILSSDPVKIVSQKKIFPPKYMPYAAAVILIFLSIAVFLFTKNNIEPTLIAEKKEHMIVPGSNKATLTLSNGVKINLYDAANGNIATQANVTIKKAKNGLLVYEYGIKDEHESRYVSEPVFNTITTPKGGQYEVVLPDGSRVWLNAASSLKYPAQFTPNEERVVELDGEGYFEIVSVQRLKAGSQLKEKVPFTVISNRQRIEVVGTKFNVNAYTDESDIKTTLVEGAVKVGALSNIDQDGMQAYKMLLPGQQSELLGNELKIKEVNTEFATAWKNGSFQFDNEDIQVVMRKIARWYDIEVDYQGNMEGKVFSGTISRYKDVNAVLKMLQLTGSVSFTIKGRKIIVS